MAQEDYFLKIEGVKGESQDDKHKDEIHVSSFSFGVTNAGTGGSNLGSGGGRSNIQDMHFTKVTDAASPNLFIACATGKHFPKATVTVRRAGEKPQEYLTYELTEVYISSITTSGQIKLSDRAEMYPTGLVKLERLILKASSTAGGKPLTML